MTPDASQPPEPGSGTLFDQVGGQAVFDALARRLRDRIAADGTLSALFAGVDPTAFERRFAAFLSQYFGGPRHYAALRGAPRLQARHAPYRIAGIHREAWLRAMDAALAETVAAGQLSPSQTTVIRDYVTAMAQRL